jgi:hypothetical protein
MSDINQIENIEANPSEVDIELGDNESEIETIAQEELGQDEVVIQQPQVENQADL